MAQNEKIFPLANSILHQIKRFW